MAFATLPLPNVQALGAGFPFLQTPNGEERRWKNHPFGLGKNILGVLVQVHLRMVQIPELTGSIFSGSAIRIML
jgi:hypothetical protein